MPYGLLLSVLLGQATLSLAVPLLTNGDFSAPVALQGWRVPLGTVTTPTGTFALIGGGDGSNTNSLVQEAISIQPLQTFVFDFVFATEASISVQGFPDSFAVSMTAPGIPGAFLDVMQIDVTGGVDTSGPFSSINTAPFVTLTSPVTIPDFIPSFTPGFTVSGRLTLDLRDARFLPLVGVPLTVAFDVIDAPDGFMTVAAIDRIGLEQAAPTVVPEPASLVLLGSCLAGGILWRTAQRRRSGRMVSGPGAPH